MKKTSSIKSKQLRSKDIQVVARKKSGKRRLFIICKTNPKLKAKQ
jgi:ribosomal protein L36